MGADNWMICPKCAAQAEAEKENAQKQAEEAYGKVSQEEYLSLVEKAKREVKLEDTLREDWEIGIFHDRFKVIYSASCRKCGYRYEYDVDKPAIAPDS